MKRSIAVVLVAVAIVAGCGVGWALASMGVHSTGATPPNRTTGSGVSSAPVPSQSPTATSTRFSNGDMLTTTSAGVGIVTFTTANGDIKKASDVTKLHLTSDEFRSFIGDQLTNQKTSCPNAEIRVDRFSLPAAGSPHSFAVGGMGGCGGNQALWTDEYGTWQLLIGTQDAWHCPELRRYHVPNGLIDHCAELQAPPVTSTEPLRIISFHDPAHQGQGIYVQKAADTALLKGTSVDFRNFIGSTAAALDPKHLCKNGAVGITVDGYATDTYAIGAVNDCGGYVAIWGNLGYGWQELIGSQAEFICQQLHDDGVPVGLVPGDSQGNAALCWDLTTNKSIRYTG